jgi:hypothetical protein
MSHRAPGILTCSCTGDGGHAVHLSWKCSRPSGLEACGARWELRRVLASVGGQQQPHKLLKEQRDILNVVFGDFDLLLSAHIFPSRKSLVAKQGPGLLGPGDVEQEWTVTTQGLVVLLHHWAFSKRKLADREAAKLASQAFFERCLDLEAARSMPLELTAQSSQLCQASCRGGMCCHACDFSAKLSSLACSPQHKVNQAIQLASLQVRSCAALKAHALAIVATALGLIHTNLDNVLKTDILKHSAELELLTASGKRRRIDEDLRDALATQAHAKGLGWSTGSIANCKDICTRATSTKMDTSFLCQYKAGGHLLMQKFRSVTISMDCSRLGNPADDTLLCAWWEALRDTGGWLAPQVTQT